LSRSTRDWQNPVEPFDVTGDGFVSPADALAVINSVNPWVEQMSAYHHNAGDPWLDVNGDIVVSILDAEDVIDKLNVGNGSVLPPWRNNANPLDVNHDGQATSADLAGFFAFRNYA